MHRITQQIYSTAEAARAAGVSAGTLNTRIVRGELRLFDHEPESLRHPGTGRSRMFSALRILQIALGERLARAGIDARKAYDLALAFTDHNSLDNEQGALMDHSVPEPRLPGDVHPEGTTVFRVLVPFDAATDVVVSIDNITDASAASSLFMHNHARFASVLLIDLGELRSRVLATLGV